MNTSIRRILITLPRCAPLLHNIFRAGHSLWLIPREPARSRIQTIIDHHSTDKGTVNFGAHVTLIAGLEPQGGAAEVLAKAESLASKLKPISARVERTGCMDLYFKSVSFTELATFVRTYSVQYFVCLEQQQMGVDVSHRKLYR